MRLSDDNYPSVRQLPAAGLAKLKKSGDMRFTPRRFTPRAAARAFIGKATTDSRNPTRVATENRRPFRRLAVACRSLSPFAFLATVGR